MRKKELEKHLVVEKVKGSSLMHRKEQRQIK